MNALSPINSTKALMARSVDESREPLLILFSAYPEPYSDKGAAGADELMAARVSAYMLGLEGLPGWAIKQAVTDFIQGKIERPARRKGALPTVEEVSVEARIHVDKEASRQRAERQRAEQLAEERYEMPLEHRVRMGFKMALLSAAWASPLTRMDRLADANQQGMDHLMALAQEWSVPIPESLWEKPHAA